MALEFHDNVITPLNTLGLKIELAEMNPLAHMAIFGDDDARPSMMLKALIEFDLAAGRKVIAIGFNTSYAAMRASQPGMSPSSISHEPTPHSRSIHPMPTSLRRSSLRA